jgi:hypothetical protein
MDANATPTWRAALDELAARHADAAEGIEVSQSNVRDTHPNKGEAEEGTKVVSNECQLLRKDIIVSLSRVPDREIALAYPATGDSGLRADALSIIMKLGLLVVESCAFELASVPILKHSNPARPAA